MSWSILSKIHCAKPPLPGRPSSWCPRHEGAGPPLLRGEGLVYRTMCFEGRWPGVTWPLRGVRLRRQGTGREGWGGGGDSWGIRISWKVLPCMGVSECVITTVLQHTIRIWTRFSFSWLQIFLPQQISIVDSAEAWGRVITSRWFTMLIFNDLTYKLRYNRKMKLGTRRWILESIIVLNGKGHGTAAQETAHLGPKSVEIFSFH